MLNIGPDGLMSVLATLEKTSVRVRPRQCSKLRHRKSGCSRCSDVCPTGAIVWKDMALDVDPGKCNSCGFCVAVCPTGALEGKGPTNTEMLVQARDLAKERPTVAFTCKSYLRSRSVGGSCVRIGCLGRLDESVLVGSVAWGASEVLLVEGACEGCALAAGRKLVETAVERSRQILAAFGSRAKITFVPELPADMKSNAKGVTGPANTSRRDFFAFLAGRARESGTLAAAAVLGIQPSREETALKPGELPYYLPAKRRILLAAMSRLGQPEAADLQGEEGYWGSVRFNSKCNGCRICAQFCPTAALAKTEENGTLYESFTVADCTACMLCRDMCFWKAVEFSSAVPLADVMARASRKLVEGRAPYPGL